MHLRKYRMLLVSQSSVTFHYKITWHVECMASIITVPLIAKWLHADVLTSSIIYDGNICLTWQVQPSSNKQNRHGLPIHAFRHVACHVKNYNCHSTHQIPYIHVNSWIVKQFRNPHIKSSKKSHPSKTSILVSTMKTIHQKQLMYHAFTA